MSYELYETEAIFARINMFFSHKRNVVRTMPLQHPQELYLYPNPFLAWKLPFRWDQRLLIQLWALWCFETAWSMKPKTFKEWWYEVLFDEFSCNIVKLKPKNYRENQILPCVIIKELLVAIRMQLQQWICSVFNSNVCVPANVCHCSQ